MKKRIISMMLAVILTFSLCACGNTGPHPLSVDFQTEDELITALETYFKTDYDKNWKGLKTEEWNEKVIEVTEVLKNNTAIHHYFHRSDEAVALARRLNDDDSIGGYFSWLVFEACNTTDWYAGIAEDDDLDLLDGPLFFSAWYYDRPTFDTVADAIRGNFKDPLSVSVLSGEWSFIKPVNGYYEGPLNYVGIVEVRATNSFGGYVTQKYVIEGRIKGEIKLIGEYIGYPNQWTGIDSDFYKDYNAIATPKKMEAENIPMP